MIKKIISYLLSILLLFGMIELPGVEGLRFKPLTVQAAVVTTAQYLGENRITKGNWIGVYGSEGYILPYFTTKVSGGNKDTAAADLASLPSYVSGYKKTSSSNYIIQNPTTDVRGLQSPTSDHARKLMQVYSGTSWKCQFDITDDKEHSFAVHVSDFGSSESNTTLFEILDLSGKVLDSRKVGTINTGVYLSYKIKGSFVIRATVVTGSKAIMNGFFFDEMPVNSISGITLGNAAARSVQINWTNSNPANAASILRKKQGDAEYTQIATVANSVYTYTDQNLEAGMTYFYKLRSVYNYRYSDPSGEYQISIPAYKNTVLQFADNSIKVNRPGDSIMIRASLKDTNNNVLPGKRLDFELQGEYVGTYIDKTIGSATTDDKGEVALAYTPQFEGEYKIKGEFKADDVELINAAQSTVTLSVYGEKWQSPPVLIRASDAVKPDTLLSINGYGMKSTDMNQIKVKAKISDGQYYAAPPSGAIDLPIEQNDVQGGYFLAARLPANAAPGQYDVWVSNEFGWSAPIKINAPRPLFISEYEVFDGLDIKMSGRNFDAGEYGVSATSLVRLNNDHGGIYPVSIKGLTPYSVEFTVTNVPLGEYWVEVSSNSGFSWVRLTNGQTLTVVSPGPDPLRLGVAWAKEFKWDSVFNVLDYGAIANDNQDDTQAIANAINAAAQNGGVVYFPKGNYHASAIGVQADVVLLGEDENNTILYYTGDGNSNFIQSAGIGKTQGRHGVAKLGIRLTNDDIRPDTFVYLGEDWGASVNDKSLRSAEKLFVCNVNLDYKLDTPSSLYVSSNGAKGRGQGAMVVAKERLVFKNSDFKGWFSGIQRAYLNQYASITNNRFEYSRGYVVCSATYYFCENNHVISHPESNVETHGIFARDNVHIANNIIEGTGPNGDMWNDGEAICVEMPSSYFNVGDVLGATEKQITIAPVKALLDYPLKNGELSIVIVSGKGLGQYRKIKFRQNNVYTLDEAWDIIPDRTSRFTIIAPNENVTMYKNTAIDCAKGIWFYGNVFDGVIADNISINSEGIFVYSSLVKGSGRLTPSYFNQVKGNILSGVSRRSRHSEISAHSQRSGTGGKYYGVGVYGLDIKDNKVIGVPSEIPVDNTEAPHISGITSISATFSSEAPTDNIAGDNSNVVIENNLLEDLKSAINLSVADYGHLLKGNKFENVQTEINNLGIPQNTRVLNEPFKDMRGPFWPAGSELNFEKVNETTYRVSWPKAYDNVNVEYYRLYIGGTLIGTMESDVSSHTITLEDGKHELPIRVEAIDSANGKSIVDLMATFEVVVDTSAPETLIQCSGTLTNDWYSSDVSVTLHAADTLSRIEKTEYKLEDNSDWLAYTTPITVSKEGTYILQYRSSDKAGNVEEAKQLVIKIDRIAPVSTETQDGTIRSDGTYNSNTVVTLTAIDNEGGSGVLKIEYSMDGASWVLYSEPILLTDNGTYSIRCKSVDTAGNTEPVKSITITIAMSPDVMTLYLKDRVIGMGLDPGMTNSLISKLDSAVKSIMKSDKNSFVNQLNAFTNEVNAQSGKKLTEDQASELKASVNKIITVLRDT